MRNLRKSLVWAEGAFVALGFALSGSAAVLYTETFTGSSAGWIDRDNLIDWDVSYNPGFGNPSGSLEGYFYPQDTPAPETDAWRINSGANFLGDYYTDVPTFTAWRFSFYAQDTLPSDLTVRFGDGVNVFALAVGSGVTSVGSWFTVTVPLTYGVGWYGGSALDFANALGGVTFIDVQVTRSGDMEQYYFMDNFELTDDPVNVASAIPEPSTGLFWFGAILLYGLRRHIRPVTETAEA